MMHVSARGRALIRQFEGFREHAYQDVVGVWTIGFGFTRGVQPGQHMTLQQAEARLITELLGYEQAVLSGCTIPPNQNQLDAMCSLAWNIGVTGFLRSTVLKCAQPGRHPERVPCLRIVEPCRRARVGRVDAQAGRRGRAVP